MYVHLAPRDVCLRLAAASEQTTLILNICLKWQQSKFDQRNTYSIEGYLNEEGNVFNVQNFLKAIENTHFLLLPNYIFVED